MCGLTCVGTAYAEHNGGKKAYYVRTGKNNQRGLCGERGERCPSKAISGYIEELVWRDVEGFLRNPGEVLQQLSERQTDQTSEREGLRQRQELLKKQLQTKSREKNAVITLFRKQSISEQELDSQLAEVRREEDALSAQLERGERQLQATQQTESHMASATKLLDDLHRNLDEPINPERKREIVQALVKSIRVDTTECDGKKQAAVTVQYSFLPTTPTPDFTDTPETQCWGIERVYQLVDDQLNHRQRQKITRFTHRILKDKPDITVNQLMDSISKKYGVNLSISNVCHIRQHFAKIQINRK